jgi:Fic family protein
MKFNRKEPYNDLPLLPPKQDFYESLNIYKILSKSRASLAELKGRSPIIPNPLMLINTLVLQEARDSSTIENIFTSNDKLYRAFALTRMEKDTNTKEVLHYREALWHSYQILKKNKVMGLDLVINIFQVIKGSNKEGIRKNQIWIDNGLIRVYSPPEPGKVLINKIKNWIEYENSNSIDPLIKMALLHYQFESIHPFSDGNGRTGRILNVLFLCHKNLLDLPILYLSKYILEHKTEYYRLFAEVTEHNKWEEWIIFMLKAVDETAKFTLAKVNSIYDLFKETQEIVKGKASDIYSYELVELLFQQPYCKISFLVEHKIVSRNTASRYLNRLVNLGILERKEEGREVIYLNKRLYQVLLKS